MLLKFIAMKWTFFAYLYIWYSILPVLPYIYNVNDFHILSIVLILVAQIKFLEKSYKTKEKFIIKLYLWESIHYLNVYFYAFLCPWGQQCQWYFLLPVFVFAFV